MELDRVYFQLPTVARGKLKFASLLVGQRADIILAKCIQLLIFHISKTICTVSGPTTKYLNIKHKFHKYILLVL